MSEHSAGIHELTFDQYLSSAAVSESDLQYMQIGRAHV